MADNNDRDRDRDAGSMDIQNHIPKFASSSSSGDAAFLEVDLDEIFADHFFPEDIDFADFFAADNSLNFGDSMTEIRSNMFDASVRNTSFDALNKLDPNQSYGTIDGTSQGDSEEGDNMLLIPPPTHGATASNSVAANLSRNSTTFTNASTSSTNTTANNTISVESFLFAESTTKSPRLSARKAAAALHATSGNMSDDGSDDKPTKTAVAGANNKKGTAAPSRTNAPIPKRKPRQERPIPQPPLRSASLKGQNAAVDHDDEDEDEDGEEDKFRVERRERNREHAKKSRVRKRVVLDTLSGQLEALRQENVNLRRVVAERLPHLAPKILHECTTVESGLLTANSEIHLTGAAAAAATAPRQQYAKILMEPDFRLIHALLHSQQNFCLSDPSLPDNPIIYCSDGFLKLSGYKRHEVLGRNCRFLQGPGTDPRAVEMIRKGIKEGRDVSVCLLNYKADGTPFWNQFLVAALRDAEGKIVNYAGIQVAVNSLPVADIKDRVKKLPIPVGI